MMGALPGSEIDPLFDYKNGAATSLNVDANKSSMKLERNAFGNGILLQDCLEKNLLLPKRKVRNGSYRDSHQWAPQYYSMYCP